MDSFMVKNTLDKWQLEFLIAFIVMKGLMEFAGVDKSERSKRGGWTMQEWTYQHGMARVDNTGSKGHVKLKM